MNLDEDGKKLGRNIARICSGPISDVHSGLIDTPGWSSGYDDVCFD